MHPDNNARPGDRLPEISNSPDNTQLTNILRRLLALEVSVDTLWERQREERERNWDSAYAGDER
jgi:hypothetical protein